MGQIYKSFSILFILSFTAVLFSQIPNPGFEQWTVGNPDEWFTTNIIGFGTPVTQTSPGHSGSRALKGEVITIISGDTLVPFIVSGTLGQGFPVLERYGAVTGYHKFSPVGGDEFAIIVLMYNNDNAIGSGALFIPTATSNFTQFSVPIEYFSGDIPDKCIIEIVIENTQGNFPHPGSYYIIDDLAFSAATGIDRELVSGIPSAFELQQNFPNPFNPVTHIRYALPQANQVKLEVYNSLGQKVTELVNEYQRAGNHVVEFQAGSLPSGIYFYRITAGSYQKMMKMMLMK
jgi:Secretion system C-terminal sorting domain